MFIKKLWRGEYSLVVTYWVFNVLIGNIIIGNSFLILEFTKSPVYYFTALIIYLLYMLVAVVGLWKSATAYKGNETWKLLAKISVVFGVIILCFSFYNLAKDIKVDEFQQSVILRPQCQIQQLKESNSGVEVAVMVRSTAFCQTISRNSMVKKLSGDIETLERQIKDENLDPIGVEMALVQALIKENKFSPLNKYQSLSECQTKELKSLNKIGNQAIYLKLIDEYCDQYIAISRSIKLQYDFEGATKAGYSYKEIASYLDKKY